MTLKEYIEWLDDYIAAVRDRPKPLTEHAKATLEALSIVRFYAYKMMEAGK